MLEEKTFTNLQEHINNIYKRGIANNIIGAFFIEECKEMKNVDEKSINNKFDLKKDKKDDKSSNLTNDKTQIFRLDLFNKGDIHIELNIILEMEVGEKKKLAKRHIHMEILIYYLPISYHQEERNLTIGR